MDYRKFAGHRLPPVINKFLPLILPTQNPEWKTFTGKVRKSIELSSYCPDHFVSAESLDTREQQER